MAPGRQEQVFVKEMVPGYAAHSSGQVQGGDVVEAVDNVPTRGRSLDEVRRMFSGQANSRVLLDLSRSGQRIRVSLERSDSQR